MTEESKTPDQAAVDQAAVDQAAVDQAAADQAAADQAAADQAAEETQAAPLVGLERTGQAVTIDVPNFDRVGGMRKWMADLDGPQLVCGASVAAVEIAPVPEGQGRCLYVGIMANGGGTHYRKVGLSKYKPTPIDGVAGRGLAFVELADKGALAITVRVPEKK